MLGGGCPKYGDYNGNACAGGRLFMAWASATPPTGVPPGAGIDTFTDSRVVCCVPQIQTAGSLNFGSTVQHRARDAGTWRFATRGRRSSRSPASPRAAPATAYATPGPGYPMDIVAGNCQTLQVTFNPNAPGRSNGTLSIAEQRPGIPHADGEPDWLGGGARDQA